MNLVKLGAQDTINWTCVEKEVATTFQVRKACVNNLRQEFLATGEVMVWERRVAAPDEEYTCAGKNQPPSCLS